MFDFVPFTGARWQVMNVNDQAGLIGQGLEFPLSQPEAADIAAARIGGSAIENDRFLFKEFLLPFVEYARCDAMFLAHIGNTGFLERALPKNGHLFIPGVVTTWWVTGHL